MFSLQRWPLAVAGLIIFGIAWVIQSVGDFGFAGDLTSYIIFAIGGRLLIMGVWKERGEANALHLKSGKKGYRKRYAGLFIIPIAVLLVSPTLSASAPPGYYLPGAMPPFQAAGNSQIFFDDFATDDSSNYKYWPGWFGRNVYDATDDHWDADTRYTGTYRNLSEPMTYATNHTVSMDLYVPPTIGSPQEFQFHLNNRTDDVMGTCSIGDTLLRLYFADSGGILLWSGIVKVWNYTTASLNSEIIIPSQPCDVLGSTLTLSANRVGHYTTWKILANNVKKAEYRCDWNPAKNLDRFTIMIGNAQQITNLGFYIDNIGFSKYTSASALAVARSSANSCYALESVMFDARQSRNYTDALWTLYYRGALINSTALVWNFTFNFTGTFVVQLNVTDGMTFDLDVLAINVTAAPETEVVTTEESPSIYDSAVEVLSNPLYLAIIAGGGILGGLALTGRSKKRRR